MSCATLLTRHRACVDAAKRLQELLGYNIFPPFVGYVDGAHPRKVLDVED